MENEVLQHYRYNAGKRPQRTPATKGPRPANLKIQVNKAKKASLTSPIGGIPPRKSSLRSSKQMGKSSLSPKASAVGTRNQTQSRGLTNNSVAATISKATSSKSRKSSDSSASQKFLDDCRAVALSRRRLCEDVHHQEDGLAHSDRLDRLEKLNSTDRLLRAQEIFLRDHTARPVVALGLPTWSSPNMRELLYNGNLSNKTSKIESPRTRTHFLDWQADLDAQERLCWHGVDTYNLDPLCREARQELSRGVPRRVMPYHEGLRLLERRPTLDVLTAEERKHLVDWWEHHFDREVTTPIKRKFPWVRFGERHYLQRKARQAEKDRNQDLYDAGLLSPGTAATLRENGKLHADYRARARKTSLSLSKYPTEESKLTTRTW